MALVYELTKQYPYKVEEVIAKFTHEKDAVDYLKERAHRDHVTKVETTWRLYHQSELINEVSSIEGTQSDGESSESPGAGNRLSPSPLSTSLRPSGSLPAREQDDKNEDDDI